MKNKKVSKSTYKKELFLENHTLSKANEDVSNSTLDTLRFPNKNLIGSNSPVNRKIIEIFNKGIYIVLITQLKSIKYAILKSQIPTLNLEFTRIHQGQTIFPDEIKQIQENAKKKSLSSKNFNNFTNELLDKSFIQFAIDEENKIFLKYDRIPFEEAINHLFSNFLYSSKLKNIYLTKQKM